MPDPMLFERDPERYRRARPPYPDELWDLLAALGVAVRGARVLDVAAGTGQATGPLLERGAAVDAVEPGEGLAALLAQAHPEVAVQVSRIEDAALPEAAYDGIVCATALHWPDLDTALPKFRRALRPGGVLVPFWHVFWDPFAPVTEFRAALNEMFGSAPTVPGTPLDRDLWRDRLTSTGDFDVSDVRTWRWSIDLDTARLRDLLETFNGWTPEQVDHAVRTAESLGGSITEHFCTTAYVCRAAATSAHV